MICSGVHISLGNEVETVQQSLFAEAGCSSIRCSGTSTSCGAEAHCSRLRAARRTEPATPGTAAPETSWDSPLLQVSGAAAGTPLRCSFEARAKAPVVSSPLLRWATSIGLIARTTPLHPPGAPEVDASRQPEERDRALSNSVATPGQAAVLEEAVGACPRSCRPAPANPVPTQLGRRSAQSDSQRPNVALLSSPTSVCAAEPPIRRFRSPGLRRQTPDPARRLASPAFGDERVSDQCPDVCFHGRMLHRPHARFATLAPGAPPPRLGERAIVSLGAELRRAHLVLCRHCDGAPCAAARGQSDRGRRVGRTHQTGDSGAGRLRCLYDSFEMRAATLLRHGRVTEVVREEPRGRAGRRDWFIAKRATRRSASRVPRLVRACRSCLCRASDRATDAALSRFVHLRRRERLRERPLSHGSRSAIRLLIGEDGPGSKRLGDCRSRW
jgi:hypothetical protein